MRLANPEMMFLCVMLTATTALYSADVTETWEMTVELSAGAGAPTFTFKQRF